MNFTDKELILIGAFTGLIGTLSGIISLIVSIYAVRKDRRNLEVYFEKNFGDVLTLKENHKLAIVSLGKQDVYIYGILYRLKLPNFKKFIKFLYYRKDKYIWLNKLEKQILIKSGESISITIELINGITLYDIDSIYVIDGTFRKWKVPWSNSKKSIDKLIVKQISSGKFENEKRIVSYTAQQGDNIFTISVTFNGKPNWIGKTTGRSKKIFSKDRYKNMFNDLVNNQIPKFMNGEVDEIQ